MSEPIRVVVTGGAGQIAYALIPYIAQGYIFGDNQKVIIHLLDIPQAEKVLGGVVMEIEDLAYPLVAGVVATSDLEAAFKDVDFAIFLGAFPRKDGMERKDLLEKNVGIFKAQGTAVANFAKPTCKCLVVGNPANTNCLTLMRHTPAIPKENFSCLTRLDHNRAVAAVAAKLNVNVQDVEGTFIWGNHSSTQYPDLHHAKANGQPVLPQVGEEWFKTEFIPKIQKRGAAVIAARGLSSAASAAKATADHVRDWFQGTNGRVISMGVNSDGNNYGVPEGLIYSFPVVCEGGKWKIVDGFEVNEFSREKLKATASELEEEKKISEEILSK